ncbi:MAG TPA: bifunctional DNA-formamidopyrimidine glycosylase/DNA-(apurinic or apyrimidinic site) lyase [Gammaproteobacteria bacterium]|nr:bifunctional DNA-formamidopyrimidine glycosylase/DNA-(apurinic or apyrimidinic site) lyase [Gammaproteobacteria bacterium]
MPELPEVETTRRGIAPLLTGQTVERVVVRQPRLRWPVPDLEHLTGRRLEAVDRRAKYLLLRFPHGTLLMHLGMSGSLRVLPPDSPPQAHDHFELHLGGRCLRLRDPRRFGAVLWTDRPPEDHPLLRDLGPEPLSEAFDAGYLHAQAQRRQVPIKQLLMDGKVVVGVGNIYATESLFLAGIHPARACRRIARARIARLVDEVKAVLERAIAQGGTTLRDFQRQDGRPGYFAQELLVYGRAGQPCPRCGRTLKSRLLGQRNTTWCPGCQR